MTQIIVLSTAHHNSFLLDQFSVEYRFHFQISWFLQENHLALLKDRYLKKMLLRRAETIAYFS